MRWGRGPERSRARAEGGEVPTAAFSEISLRAAQVNLASALRLVSLPLLGVCEGSLQSPDLERPPRVGSVLPLGSQALDPQENLWRDARGASPHAA